VENIVKVHSNGEPTLGSIGLGGYTPVGLVQNFLEFMHISLDIPWWTTIVIATVCARTLIFPLVIKSQKNLIKLTNHMPSIQEKHKRLTEARNSGDHVESARAATELMTYMKKNDVSFTKNVIVQIVQAPVFISFFFFPEKNGKLACGKFERRGLLVDERSYSIRSLLYNAHSYQCDNVYHNRARHGWY